jgi:hypothetical protein
MGVGLVGTGPGIGSVGTGNGGCSGGIGTSGGICGGLSIVVIFVILIPNPRYPDCRFALR